MTQDNSTGGGLWAVPRLFEGRTVAIIATGPSLKQADVDLCWQLPAIAVNNGFEYAPWAVMLYSSDAKFWMEYWNKGRLGGAGAGRFNGYKVTVADGGREFRAPGMLVVGNGGDYGFDERPDHLRTGKNSAAAAAHLAAQAGAARILLLGCDAKAPLDREGRAVRGQSHAFGDHRGSAGRCDPSTGYPHFLAGWEHLAPALAARGVKVVNCSPDSAIDCFPRMPLAQCLGALKKEGP